MQENNMKQTQAITRRNLEKPQLFLSGLLFGLGVGLFIGAVGIPMWFSL